MRAMEHCTAAIQPFQPRRAHAPPGFRHTPQPEQFPPVPRALANFELPILQPRHLVPLVLPLPSFALTHPFPSSLPDL